MIAAPTIANLTAMVEAEMKDIFTSRDMALHPIMSYHLGWQDERGSPRTTMSRDRPHGVACLTACHAAGGGIEVALPAAASVEMVDSFCQIHDDVQGGVPKRHDRDAVWWVWGPAQAINAGDGMHALSRLALFRLGARGVSPETTFQAVQMLDEASLELCEGRFRDLEAQERIDMSVEAYLEMASSKSGTLLSCAMRLGALLACVEETAADAFGVCGDRIGVALQVREDLRQLWGTDSGDGSPGAEVLNKKKLLPVVRALEKANISQKRRIGDIYFKRVLEPQDVPSILGLLEELGAREYCEELLTRYREEAEEAVASSGASPDGQAALNGLIDSLLRQ